MELDCYDIHFIFFFNDPATTEIYTLSLHDALPISADGAGHGQRHSRRLDQVEAGLGGDRKSTRLNSSHVAISYAVFCLKKITQRAIPGRIRRSSKAGDSACFRRRCGLPPPVIWRLGGRARRASRCFFFNGTATTEIYTLSLHDALPN